MSFKAIKLFDEQKFLLLCVVKVMSIFSCSIDFVADLKRNLHETLKDIHLKNILVFFFGIESLNSSRVDFGL